MTTNSRGSRWRRSFANEQARLTLIAGVPSLILAVVALVLADVSVYLVVFCTLVLGLVVIFCVTTARTRADYQIQTLSNLVESMIDGEYSLRAKRSTHPAFHDLLELINTLAAKLSEQRIELTEGQLLLSLVLDQMDAAVLAVRPNGQFSMLNESARRLLKVEDPGYRTRTLEEVGLAELVGREQPGTVQLSGDSFEGEYFVYVDRFMGQGEPQTLFLLTKADRLLREKERDAWRSLLRVLGHELNNSLVPIGTISRTLIKSLADRSRQIDREKLHDGLEIIDRRAQSLGQFVQSYSRLSQLPAPNRRLLALSDVLDRTALLFPDEELRVDCPADLQVFADSQQIEQVLINLVKNSVESMGGEGEGIIEISCRFEEGSVLIQIRDCGVGVANKENLFVPFYSTKAKGSGIGLVLCQQILMNHNGSIKLEDRESGVGTVVSVRLPKV